MHCGLHSLDPPDVVCQHASFIVGATERKMTYDFLVEKCPSCASAGHEVYADFPELTWVRCVCGLIYKRRQSAGLGPLYDDAYFRTTAGASRPYSTRRGHRIRKARRQILDLLNHTEPGPLLDIGSSLGYTLQAARHLGLDATGLDVSDFALQQCRELGFRAEKGDMSRLPFPDCSFRLVIMKHVFEHTSEPRVALREVARVLAPGGGLFLAVPDARYAKAVMAPQKSTFYRPDRHGPAHFIYYTPATLAALLETEGFRVRRVGPHLLHRRAGVPGLAGEVLLAPFRAIAWAFLGAFSLPKEFWLVATR